MWKFAVFVADFRPRNIRREGRHKRHGHGVADAHKGRIRERDAPLGGQAMDAASLSDYEKSLSNCERDGGSVASARDADAVVPFVV